MVTIKHKKIDQVNESVSNALKNEVESLYSVLGLSNNKPMKIKPNNKKIKREN